MDRRGSGRQRFDNSLQFRFDNNLQFRGIGGRMFEIGARTSATGVKTFGIAEKMSETDAKMFWIGARMSVMRKQTVAVWTVSKMSVIGVKM
jgi:hypothetical protein